MKDKKEKALTGPENEQATDRGRQLKRWVLTINNPFWDTEKDVEADIGETVLPGYYDTEIIGSEACRDCFVFKRVHAAVKDGEGNYSQAVVERPYFKDMDSVRTYIEGLEHFKYAVYQLEQGENGGDGHPGTPHIQAGVIFETGKRFYTMKKYFPTAHIEPAKGTNAEVREYCTKPEGRISGPVEIGRFCEMRSRNDIEEFLELVKSGVSNITIKKLFPVLYAQYGPEKIERFRQDELKEEFGSRYRTVKVTYIYGKARLGKTTYIYDNYPMKDICRVNEYYKGPFEEYNFQKILVLDEFTGKLDITFLNNLLDKFPVQLPARFANRTACFEQVFIVSNLPLAELYKEQQASMPEVYNAFIQRINDIILFTGFNEWRYEQKDFKRVITGPVPPPAQVKLKLADLKPLSAAEQEELGF